MLFRHAGSSQWAKCGRSPRSARSICSKSGIFMKGIAVSTCPVHTGGDAGGSGPDATALNISNVDRLPRRTHIRQPAGLRSFCRTDRGAVVSVFASLHFSVVPFFLEAPSCARARTNDGLLPQSLEKRPLKFLRNFLPMIGAPHLCRPTTCLPSSFCRHSSCPAH